eukprot:289885-Rhodomonas_salina.2
MCGPRRVRGAARREGRTSAISSSAGPPSLTRPAVRNSAPAPAQASVCVCVCVSPDTAPLSRARTHIHALSGSESGIGPAGRRGEKWGGE